MQTSNGNVPGDMFFAAYSGPSMNPTLREPEMMEILPYNSKPVRVGDVVFFLPAGSDHPVVHRILRVSPAGIATLGDNNTREDAFLLQPKSIQGRVVAAWRGHKRRKIAGGSQGRLSARWLRWRRILERGVSPVLHPLYQDLAQWGWIARLLPAPLRPRLVVFHVRGRDQFQLLVGKRSIGQYDDHKNQWQIQAPFRLFVDAKALHRQQDKQRSNPHSSLERQRTLQPVLRPGGRHELCLADGSRWRIAAGNEQAVSIVSQLGEVMQLGLTSEASEASDPGEVCRLLVQVEAQACVTDFRIPLASKNDGGIVCVMRPYDPGDGLYIQLMLLSLVIARQAQARGGVLIHGALAELDGMGVILAAPGGTGKSTASKRLPAPWRSRCDDITLVVRDAQGKYRAHPWPTWSRFMDGGAGGSWDVQGAIPVKGLFFLSRAAADRVEPVGAGHAVSLLVECAEQASQLMARGLSKAESRALHLERFNNLCALADGVPAHLLHISLTGAFWQEIEKAL